MKRSISRRPLLSGVGMLVLSSLTGCLSMFAAEQTQIENIKFVNMDENSHDITVVVESQGETVFETVQEVPPYDETQPVLTYDDGIPTDTARYTVRAEVDSGSDSIERTYPTEYNGGDCYTVTVRIDQNGTLREIASDGAADGCVS